MPKMFSSWTLNRKQPKIIMPLQTKQPMQSSAKKNGPVLAHWGRSQIGTNSQLPAAWRAAEFRLRCAPLRC
jgi:hypothetical protein